MEVIQDLHSYLPLSNLRDGDLILLLTPGIVPEASPLNSGPESLTSDPFEPLGKALARHHPWVRHVPYLPRNGITGTHVVHIRLAAVIIFVISGPPRHGQVSQVALADIMRSVCEQRPHIILTRCDAQEPGSLERSFPATMEVPSFTPLHMEAAADILFGKQRKPSPTVPMVQNLMLSPRAWPVEVWDGEHDASAVHDLWDQCFPEAFHLGRYQIESLLRRDGYAMHYVVREPRSSHIVGFCATYTTYADSGGERLLGSVAAILVHPSWRQRGVGLSLHNYAVRQLTKTRGVCRLQLGSTFPRLFYGMPVDSPWEDWFRRRGWMIKPLSTTPGTGQEVCDWFLKFTDWPATGLMLSCLTFRPCTMADFDMVLGLVEKESRSKDHVGWYDQYARLANTIHVQEVVIALDGGVVVAAALTYTKNTGSPAAGDLPWASTIADDVGGVTCVCINGGQHLAKTLSQQRANNHLPDQLPSIANKRDAVMIRLLDSCIRALAEQGMNKLLIDAVKGGDEGFQSMGERC